MEPRPSLFHYFSLFPCLTCNKDVHHLHFSLENPLCIRHNCKVICTKSSIFPLIQKMEVPSVSGQEFDSSTIYSRSSSSIHTEAVTEFSVLIDKLNPILSEMKAIVEITDSLSFEKAIDSLETDYNRAKSVMDSQTVQSSPAKHIEYLIQNLGRSLGLVLFAGHEVPISNKQTIEALCKEMMNVRFDLSSDSDIEEDNETEDETEEETGEKTGEIVEEETRILTVDDAILQIKSGKEDKFMNALLVLYGFIIDGMIPDEKIVDEDVVKMLSTRIGSCNGNERVIIIKILRYLIQQNDEHKVCFLDMKLRFSEFTLNLSYIFSKCAGKDEGFGDFISFSEVTNR